LSLLRWLPLAECRSDVLIQVALSANVFGQGDHLAGVVGPSQGEGAVVKMPVYAVLALERDAERVTACRGLKTSGDPVAIFDAHPMNRDRSRQPRRGLHLSTFSGGDAAR
jgi:hypothetical protein